MSTGHNIGRGVYYMSTGHNVDGVCVLYEYDYINAYYNTVGNISADYNTADYNTADYYHR